jgi:hypothetical protein
VNFKHRFNQKDQECFPKPFKEGHLLVDRFKKEDIEYPFEHGEVVNYTLDGVSIPVITNICFCDIQLVLTVLSYHCNYSCNHCQRGF